MHSILVTSPDILSKWCGVLRATAGLTDRDIAAKPFFSGIPPGTINSIRKHGKVPAKWKQRLHCLCPHCGRLNHDYDCTTEKPVPLEATVTMPKAPGKPRKPTPPRFTSYAGTPIEKIELELLKLTGKRFVCVDELTEMEY